MSLTQIPKQFLFIFFLLLTRITAIEAQCVFATALTATDHLAFNYRNVSIKFNSCDQINQELISSGNKAYIIVFYLNYKENYPAFRVYNLTTDDSVIVKVNGVPYPLNYNTALHNTTYVCSGQSTGEKVKFDNNKLTGVNNTSVLSYTDVILNVTAVDSLSILTTNGAGWSFLGASSGCNNLPVTLVSFSARENNKDILLQWQTATEQSSAYFDVEYSLNGLQWLVAGKINAAGNSSIIKNYTFNHSLAVTGTCYYRLKLVDINGKYNYSNVKMIKRTNTGQLNIYPNPATNELSIRSGNNEKIHSITLLNAKGERLTNFSLLNGQDKINISQYPPGLYTLCIYDEKNIMKALKFIKQ